VVTRYFGGIKLGTGGLVRAYGDAARAVLEVVPRAEKVATHILRITTPYAGFEPARRILAEHRASVLTEEFGASVVLTARIRNSDFQEVLKALAEASGGALQPEIIDTDPATILPVADQSRR
jgi:putative IMPACT (imprinted ancient) family translation regulator